MLLYLCLFPITMKFSIFLTFLATRSVSSLTGYQFVDNKSQNRFIAENGEMIFKLSRISKQFQLASAFLSTLIGTPALSPLWTSEQAMKRNIWIYSMVSLNP